MSGTLYLVPNLLGLVPPAAVLPEQTLAIARRLEHFVVETPKVARTFLKMLATHRPLRELALETLNEHTPPATVPGLLAPARAGRDVGLLADAGCPAVADPGALLVAAAHGEGIRVVPLVGPSAVLLALMASGLDGQRFAFDGYLPAKSDERAQRLRVLGRGARHEGTQIFIETPYRNEALFAAVLAEVAVDIRLCVAADLTLPTEYVACHAIGRWRAMAAPALHKRPAIFLLGAPV